MKEGGVRRGWQAGGEWSQRRIPQSQSQIESAGANVACVLPRRCTAIYIYMNKIWLVKGAAGLRGISSYGRQNQSLYATEMHLWRARTSLLGFHGVWRGLPPFNFFFFVFIPHRQDLAAPRGCNYMRVSAASSISDKWYSITDHFIRALTASTACINVNAEQMDSTAALLLLLHLLSSWNLQYGRMSLSLIWLQAFICFLNTLTGFIFCLLQAFIHFFFFGSKLNKCHWTQKGSFASLPDLWYKPKKHPNVIECSQQKCLFIWNFYCFLRVFVLLFDLSACLREDVFLNQITTTRRRLDEEGHPKKPTPLPMQPWSRAPTHPLNPVENLLGKKGN